MPYEAGQKTMVVSKHVVCPFLGNKPLDLEDCKACQYHKGISPIQIKQRVGQTIVPVTVAEQVVCVFPKMLDVGWVEKVTPKEP